MKIEYYKIKLKKFELARIYFNCVSHQVFVKPKTERLQAHHLKTIKRNASLSHTTHHNEQKIYFSYRFALSLVDFL
jgi:hypothetical protein